MNNSDLKKRRKAGVKTKAQQPNATYGYCRVIGCKHPPRAATNDGLDQRFCRSHAEHYQRHGSPYKASYTAKQLNPHRQAALLWLGLHEDDMWVRAALAKVEERYRSSGPFIEAFRLRGHPPKDRANAAWARLRKASIDPRLVVAAGLAVEMVIRDDPQADYSMEYRHVQAAKLIHRLASGSHKRWTRDVADPHGGGTSNKVVVNELHVYPRPRGRVLRIIGQQVDEATELLVDHRIDTLRSYKKERDRLGRFSDRPWPKGWKSKSRYRG